jgi:hypothetical protein
MTSERAYVTVAAVAKVEEVKAGEERAEEAAAATAAATAAAGCEGV